MKEASWVVQVAKYQFKMAAAAILDFWINLNNSAILSYSYEILHRHPQPRPKGDQMTKMVTGAKFRWRRPPSWISLNGHNSAIFN